MKRVIRILDVLFALILTVIYTFVIAGSAMMPDTMIVRNSKDRVIGKIYSVSALNDESVDFQSAKAV